MIPELHKEGGALPFHNGQGWGVAPTEPQQGSPTRWDTMPVVVMDTRDRNPIVPFALNGHRIPAQGIALGTACERIGVF